MSGFLTLYGSDSGEEAGSRSLGPWTISGTGNVDEILDAALNAGDNIVPVPNGAVAVVVIPAAGGPALKLRTNLNAADVGLPLVAVAAQGTPIPIMVPLATGVNEIILNAASPTTAELVFV